MTYGVVVALLVLALIATVVAVTLTSNQPLAVEPEDDRESDVTTPEVADDATSMIGPRAQPEIPESQHQEEIAHADERRLIDISEEAPNDSWSIRV